MSGIVHLNVGGQLFIATLSTLSVRGDNFFSSLLSGYIGVVKDEQGRIYVNRPPDLFVPILDYLRTGRVTLRGLDEGSVRAEAAFYGVQIPPIPERKTKCAMTKECSLIILHIAYGGGGRDDGDVYVHGPLSGGEGGRAKYSGGWNWANQYVQFAEAKGWIVESTHDSNRHKISWRMVESTLTPDSKYRKITWVLSRCL
jgi:hypothetical protein